MTNYGNGYKFKASEKATEQYEYYYEELSMKYIQKVEKELDRRLAGGSADLTLKNGMKLYVCRKANGDIQIYDDEPNLIAEFDNTGRSEYSSGFALFNATVFIIRASKRDIYC